MAEPEEPEVVIYRVDSELQAQALVGRTVIFGGCPYRVTAIRPVAELHWEVRGVGLPVHPGPGPVRPNKAT